MEVSATQDTRRGFTVVQIRRWCLLLTSANIPFLAPLHLLEACLLRFQYLNAVPFLFALPLTPLLLLW